MEWEGCTHLKDFDLWRDIVERKDGKLFLDYSKSGKIRIKIRKAPVQMTGAFKWYIFYLSSRSV